MKIWMLCGSPRPQRGNSMYLLEGLRDRLGPEQEVTIHRAYGEREPILEDLPNSGALVIAFPLYVDGLPSHLLGLLRWLQAAMPERQRPVKVYVIANNGFYEAEQNRAAIDMVWKWCDACGLTRGRALAVGAGEMLQAAPLGKGPSTNAGKALDQLAKDILNGVSGETMYVKPNFPRFLYKLAGQSGMRRTAKKNGLKAPAVKAKIPVDGDGTPSL